jgi:hypothetical protein
MKNETDDRLVLQRARVPSAPIALHLAPNSANRVLPHGAAEQSRERPAHPPRVGPGKIGAGDQRIGPFGAALVGRNGRVLPLDRLAVRCSDALATGRHRHEGSHQSAVTMTVPAQAFSHNPNSPAASRQRPYGIPRHMPYTNRRRSCIRRLWATSRILSGSPCRPSRPPWPNGRYAPN